MLCHRGFFCHWDKEWERILRYTLWMTNAKNSHLLCGMCRTLYMRVQLIWPDVPIVFLHFFNCFCFQHQRGLVIVTPVVTIMPISPHTVSSNRSNRQRHTDYPSYDRKDGVWPSLVTLLEKLESYKICFHFPELFGYKGFSYRYLQRIYGHFNGVYGSLKWW